MVSKEDKWIRIFDISDITKHKKGFTLYKVISMLYPEKCPDAITKITVWKRFNDVKKLHREIKSLHYNLKINDKFPSLPSTSFFKRFDTEIIQQRRQLILNFLEYVSIHSQLFTSNAFVKFFETSHTPSTLTNSTINNIRSDLNLPSEPEYLSFHSPESDDDYTLSDTDSTCTMSSVCSLAQISENIHDPFIEITKKLNSDISSTSLVNGMSSVQLKAFIGDLELLNFELFANAPNIEGNFSQYIIEAEKYTIKAAQYETNDQIADAFTAYLQGIYILYKYYEDSTNYDHKQTVKYKLEKYILRLERLYTIHLVNKVKDYIIENLGESFAYSIDLLVSDNIRFESLFKINEWQLLDGNIDDGLLRICIGQWQVLKYSIRPTFIDIQSNDDDLRYIEYAEKYILSGSQFESDGKYNAAYIAYKTAIYILLKYAKDDNDVDRRVQAVIKAENYLEKATKLFEMFISFDLNEKTLRKFERKIEEEKPLLQRPLSDLFKYKVLKIISSGMLVLQSESQELFYIKVIHKTCDFTKDDLILPTDVPFMVQLKHFYNCENALFLVLQYCSGLKLWDYVQQKSLEESNDNNSTKLNKIDASDNDSECSFIELLKDYNANKKMLATNVKILSDDDTFLLSPTTTAADEIKTGSDDESIKNTLLTTLDDNFTNKTEDGFEIINFNANRRKCSEASGVDDDEIEQFNDIPLEKAVKWLAQLLLALEHLHKLGVVCCDLNTNNLLINERDDLLLTYICKIESRKMINMKFYKCLAPEIYKFDKITKAADWWSYGTIIYELLVGVPIHVTHPEGFLNYTALKVPKFVSPEGKSLIKQLLVYEPFFRLGNGPNGTEEIKSHPFFNGIKWNSIEKC